MKNLSRHRSVLALALLAGIVLGCKSTTTSTSTSTSNTKEESAKNTNSNTNSNAKTNSAPAPDVAGKYNVTGTNPEGGVYKGTLEVITRGDVYQFRWNAGTQYDGVGVQNGSVIAVAVANASDGK